MAAPESRRARRRPSGAPGAPRFIGILYVLPALAVFGVFVAAPLADAVRISFQAWDGVTPAHSVGLQNYRDLVHDPAVRKAFEHVAVLIVLFALVPLAAGLVAAAALSRVRIRFLTGFRTVLFLPQILPPAVVAISWRWIYDPEGPLNAVLGAVGLRRFRHAWLGDFGIALPAVGAIGTWVTIGLCVVLFLAGIQQIDASLYEAARVDGAGAVREFFAVTLPGLRNVVAVVLALTVITALRTFDLIYLTTLGGPDDQTTVPALLVYSRAFATGQVGSAAAIAVVLTVTILVVTLVLTRLVEEREP
jgi:raffinose/stachyose/melibiose transport system permease protein